MATSVGGSVPRVAAKSSAKFRYVSHEHRVLAGDVLSRLPQEVERAGMSRPIIICSGSVGAGPQLSKVTGMLDAFDVATFVGVKSDSPAPAVRAAVDFARESASDGVIALGGGSAIVTARAMTMPERVVAASSVDFVPLQVPYLAVPTTPTTAMARLGAAVSLPGGGRTSLFAHSAHPSSILLDHDLLSLTPSSVFLDTSVATFCNSAEIFTTPGLPIPAHADLREAVALAGGALKSLAEGPLDGADRMRLAVAAYLCGRAAACISERQAAIGLAMGHQVQQLRGGAVSHGQAMAATLAGALRFNRVVTAEGQTELAAVLGARSGPSNDDEVDAVERCIALLKLTGMPTSVRDLEVSAEVIPAMAAAAFESYFTRTNVRPITSVAEMEDAFANAWE